MPIDLSSLTITRVIAHDIPRNDKKGDENAQESLVLSDVETQLDPANRNLFSERIRGSLNNTRYEARFSLEADSPVPELILRILRNDFSEENENFVQVTRRIALRLFQSQNKVNPPGLLMIVQGSLGSTDVVAILKLEKEEGLQIQSTENEDGQVTFSVTYLSDLMMTEGTKVFKVGLFIKEGDDIHSVRVLVSDKQNTSNSEVANFFLKAFLGCELLEDPKVLTKRYLRFSQDFFNHAVEDALLKTQYELALLTSINSNEDTIDPDSFAQAHLNVDDRQRFINFLTRHGVPNHGFAKNNSEIRKKIDTVYIRFSNGSSLSASLENFRNDLKIEKDTKKPGSNKIQVSFEGEIDRIGK